MIGRGHVGVRLREDVQDAVRELVRRFLRGEKSRDFRQSRASGQLGVLGRAADRNLQYIFPRQGIDAKSALQGVGRQAEIHIEPIMNPIDIPP